jgi:hypothetical protein
MHGYPTSPKEWILFTIAVKVTYVVTQSRRKAEKALIIIAFIHHLEQKANGTY